MKNSGYLARFIAMKKLTTPLLVTLLALSAASRLAAADPESSFGLAPSPAQQLPPPAPSSIPLIPEAPTQALEKPAGQSSSTDQPGTAPAKPLGDKTAMEEDKLKKMIALRQAKTKAERDPALQAINHEALIAHTDFEQRKLFLDYYNGLVDRIAKFNPTMTKEEVATLRAQYTGRFIQVRLQPTIDPATFRR